MANGAGLGIGQAILYGLNRYDQLQAQALERRLREQELRLRERELQASLRQPEAANIDLLPLLPRRVRESLYPGTPNLVVPQDVAGSVFGQILREYEPPEARLETPQPVITEDQAAIYPQLKPFVGQPTSVLRDFGIDVQPPERATTPPPPTTTVDFLLDWQEAQRTGNFDKLRQKWGDQAIPFSSTGSLSLIGSRAVDAAAGQARLDTLNQPIGPIVAAQIKQQTGLTIDPNTTLRQLQETYGGQDWVNYFIDLAASPGDRAQTAAETSLTQAQEEALRLQTSFDRRFTPREREADIAATQAGTARTEAETARTEAETARIQAQTQAQLLENQLNEEFAREERKAELKAQLLENARTSVGIEMDEAELDRFLQLTDPIVSRAVAEAASAELGLRFDQETFDASVTRVNQELQNLATQGQLDQAQLERYQQLTPILVNEAQLRVASIQFDNERKELENDFARASYGYRLSQLQSQSAIAQAELQQARLDVEAAQQRLALARRLEPTQVAQAELDLQLTQQRLQQLQLEIQQLQQEETTLSGLNPEDADFALDLYKSQIAPFVGQGMWIPPYTDFIANMMSQNPMDWNQYVVQYDQRMTQMLGEAPTDQALFPWLEDEVLEAYRTAADRFADQFSEFDLEQLEFPPIEVWWANLTSENPVSEDVLVEQWNAGLLTSDRGALLENLAQQMIARRNGDVTQVLRELDATTEEEAKAFEERYNVTIAEIARYILLRQANQ